IAGIITDDKLQRSSEEASRGIDLFDRKLHAFPVRLEESRKGLIAVELAELDRLSRSDSRGQQNPTEGPAQSCAIPFHPCSRKFHASRATHSLEHCLRPH